MLCKNCGRLLLESEEFCVECGTKTVFDKKNMEKEFDDVVVRKIDYEKSGLVNAMLMIFMAIFVASYGVFLLLINEIIIFAYIGRFCVLLSTGCVCLAVYKVMLYKKRFCLIKTKSVCGVGYGTTDLKNEQYEFLYKDIITIKKKKMSQTILVQTNYAKVAIFLPMKEIDSVYEFLLQKTNNKI